MNINDFVGTWYVQYKDGADGTPLQVNWQLWIGTDTYGDSKPFIAEDGEVCVGLALRELLSDGSYTTVIPELDQQQPSVLALSGAQLRWDGYYKGQPARIYISAAQTLTPSGNTYTYLYGSTTYGDPDQVAVWGGSGTPSSTPPPSPKGGGDDEG